jgi:nitroreductase
METLEAIYSRRSIRKYKQETIPQEIIDELLKAAMKAPSAGNEQPWHFIVIQDLKILEGLPKWLPGSAFVVEAPLVIIVCADLRLQKSKYEWWIQDCSAAAENILLAARSKGLGAVWVGIYPKEERVKNLKESLGLPENIMPLCIIPVGYPAEEKATEDRFQTSKIHYNGW